MSEDTLEDGSLLPPDERRRRRLELYGEAFYHLRTLELFAREHNRYPTPQELDREPDPKRLHPDGWHLDHDFQPRGISYAVCALCDIERHSPRARHPCPRIIADDQAARRQRTERHRRDLLGRLDLARTRILASIGATIQPTLDELIPRIRAHIEAGRFDIAEQQILDLQAGDWPDAS